MINKKNKTIRIFAWIGAIVFAIVLAVMPFMVNNRDKNVTFADSFVDNPTFEGSYIPLQSVVFDNSGDVGFGYYNVLRNDFAFSFNSYSDRFVFKNRLFNLSTWLSTTNGMNNTHYGFSEVLADVPIGLKTLTLNGLSSSSLSYSIIPNSINNGNNFVGFDYTSFDVTLLKGSAANFSLYFPYTYELCDYNNVNNGGATATSFFEIHGSTAFGVPSMLHVFYDVNSYNVLSSGSKIYYCCTYQFIDSANNSIYISFPLDQNPSYIYSFSERTYYFKSDLSDSEYYNQGVADGYSDGYSAGDSDGYNRGYNAGYGVGERTGFNDGVASANDYSFLGLFGAIVDAPLQAFTGLFDFDLSFDGVHNFNLKGFFLAILTIAIVVAIIRFALSK